MDPALTRHSWRTRWCFAFSILVIALNVVFTNIFRYYEENWMNLDVFPAEWQAPWADTIQLLEERRSWQRSFPGCEKNFFHIMVPFSNVHVPYLQKVISSTVLQSYPSFRVWLYDDGTAPTHPSYAFLNDFCRRFESSPVIHCNRHKSQLGPGGGKYHALLHVRAHAARNDIVVIVDGDDWFSTPNALWEINRAYNMRGCWVTWGSYRGLTGQAKTDQGPLPDWSKRRNQQWHRHNLNSPHNWYFSHPRSFRVFLIDYLQASDFQDERHRWLTKISDRMMMYSVIELSGAERSCYIERLLYSYRQDAQWQHHTSTTVDYFRKQSLLYHAFNQPSKEQVKKPPGVCCGSVLCVAEDIMTQWEVAETKLDYNWIRSKDSATCESSAGTNFNVLILPNNGTISTMQGKIASALMQSKRARVYLFPHATEYATTEFLRLFCETRKMNNQNDNGDVMYAVSCLKSEALGQSKSDYTGIKQLRSRLHPNDVIVVLAGENRFNSPKALQLADEAYREHGYLANELQEPANGVPLISFRAALWDAVTKNAKLSVAADELRKFLTFSVDEIREREKMLDADGATSTANISTTRDTLLWNERHPSLTNNTTGTDDINGTSLNGTQIKPLDLRSIYLPVGVCCGRKMCNRTAANLPLAKNEDQHEELSKNTTEWRKVWAPSWQIALQILQRDALHLPAVADCERNFIHIFVIVQNDAVEPLRHTLATVLSQEYPNFCLWLVDDASTDRGTVDLLKSLGKITEKFPHAKLKFIRSKHSARLASHAMYYGLQLIRANAAPNDLVLTLPVGDVLSSHYALQIINEQFISQACWVLYWAKFGPRFETRKEFIWDKNRGFWKPHVYRAFLLDGVSQESFKDANGNWLSNDQVIAPFMFDILELSSKRHGYQKSEPIFSSSQPQVNQALIQASQARTIKEGYDHAVIFPYSVCCGKKKC
eukprot:GEMP01004028.1.p1 GENE.GEMP01004028.1~~GEMP01004028.1.p1  ORF type:complete len:971 (+),score=164.07 GEMP01004028.1:88-2913(+)